MDVYGCEFTKHVSCFMGIWRARSSYRQAPCKAIFWGDVPLYRPHIGLVYGTYLEFRFLKWQSIPPQSSMAQVPAMSLVQSCSAFLKQRPAKTCRAAGHFTHHGGKSLHTTLTLGPRFASMDSMDWKPSGFHFSQQLSDPDR